MDWATEAVMMGCDESRPTKVTGLLMAPKCF
jgi:hypothetical protein